MDPKKPQRMEVLRKLHENVRLPVLTIYELMTEIKVKANVVEPRVVALPKPLKPINKPPNQQLNQELSQECPSMVLKVKDDVLEGVQFERKIDYKVYRIGDVYTGRRTLMKYLGLDIGTRTVVLAYYGDDGNVNYISEINGYWPFERSTKFVKNMLDDPNKIRSDGTQRPARWIEMPSTGEAIVLGQDAEEFAYAKNDTLRRPMAEGGISPDEEAITILGTIVHGMLETAEKELGKFDDEVRICYCTTAPAINKEINIDYHERVVNIILSGYNSNKKIVYGAIKESHAIVINQSQDGNGIGISWGAGTVTVSYIKFGIEIFSFSWVGAGDWIDEQVAMRHGYSPEALSTRKKIARETPTTVSKRKQTIDLTPGSQPNDRVGIDIVLHYDVLISTVINGIIKGFTDNESEARLSGAINVYIAGGSSSPKGFTERVAQKFDEIGAPFDIGKVIKSDKPLLSVATGCLEAAKAGMV